MISLIEWLARKKGEGFTDLEGDLEMGRSYYTWCIWFPKNRPICEKMVFQQVDSDCQTRTVGLFDGRPVIVCVDE